MCNYPHCCHDECPSLKAHSCVACTPYGFLCERTVHTAAPMRRVIASAFAHSCALNRMSQHRTPKSWLNVLYTECAHLANTHTHVDYNKCTNANRTRARLVANRTRPLGSEHKLIIIEHGSRGKTHKHTRAHTHAHRLYYFDIHATNNINPSVICAPRASSHSQSNVRCRMSERTTLSGGAKKLRNLFERPIFAVDAAAPCLSAAAPRAL